MTTITNLRQLCIDHKCSVNELAEQLGFSNTIVYAATSGKWLPSPKFTLALSKLWSLNYDELRQMFERQHRAYFDEHPDYEEHSGFYRHKGWKEHATKVTQEYKKKTAMAKAKTKAKKPVQKQTTIKADSYKADTSNNPVIQKTVPTEDPRKMVADYWHNSEIYNLICHYLYGKLPCEDFGILLKSTSYLEALQAIYAKVDYETYMIVVNRKLPK